MGTKLTGRGGRKHRLPLGASEIINMPREQLDRALEVVGVIDRQLEQQRYESMFTDPEPDFEIGFAFPVHFRQLEQPLTLQVTERRLTCNPIFGKSWEYKVTADGLPEGYSSTSHWLSGGRIRNTIHPPQYDHRAHPCADC